MRRAGWWRAARAAATVFALVGGATAWAFTLAGCGEDATGPSVLFRSGDPTPLGDLPYPNDLYLSSGRIRPGALPTRADADPDVVTRLLAALGDDDGFGATTGVFFRWRGGSGALDAATLTDQSAFLVDLSAGARVPAERHARADDGQLVVAPRPGQVLGEGQRYAAVVLDDVRDTGGHRLRADGEFERVRTGALHSELYAPLFEWLDQQGIARSRVACASVFTVHTLTAPLAAARTHLEELPPPRPSADPGTSYLTSTRLDELFGSAVVHDQIGLVVQGTIPTPYHLADDPGRLGTFRQDSPGAPPAVRATASVPYSLALPQNGGPAGTFDRLRLIVFVHGLDSERGAMFALANDLCRRGYAVLSFDLPYHGLRQIGGGHDRIHNFTGADGPDGLAEPTPQLSSLEFIDVLGDPAGTPDPLGRLDPRGARDAFRESALELAWLARLAVDADWSAVRGLDARLAGLTFEPARVLLVGQSLGSFIAALALAFEPRYQGGVLAVAGGGLFFPTLVHSLTYGPRFEPIVQGAFGIDGPHRDPVAHPPQFLFEYALYQQLLEPGDPLALAPYVVRAPIASSLPRHVLLLEAFADETVPNRATEPLAQALGLHWLGYSRQPAAGLRYIEPLPIDSAPAIADVRTGSSLVTAVLVELDPATHGMLVDPMGTRNYQPDWPPATPLPEPVPVENPTAQLRTLLLRFADSFYELGAPEVIDPFSP
jgi:hypothetical protein